MKAMVLRGPADLETDREPLHLEDVPEPEPAKGEILVKVTRCGVCHTELDEIEGRTPPSRFPVILGHQVVGRVQGSGPGAERFNIGDRVGIGWIYSACGKCTFCRSGRENLCSDFKATGRDADGGYAEYMVVHEDFASGIPEVFSDSKAAPLLCAGAIGYRSLRLADLGDGEGIGLTGFGASGHLVLKMLLHKFPGSRVFVFTRTPGERDFARELGAYWAGETAEESPEKLGSIIDTTPAWKPVVEALKNLEPGGRLVINAIRKQDGDKEALLKLDYSRDLWMEKEIKSVANITRRDIQEFLPFAAGIPLRPEVREFSLEEANKALLEMKGRKIRGAKVLKIA
ncbi:MAG: zinc-dependent alcohol dehydrogenase family protein [Nitrospirota bacterium]